jgi:pimeloyl-ACP methyl ester carboxylesterase
MDTSLAPNGIDLEAQGITPDLQLPQRAQRGHVSIDGYKLATIRIDAVGPVRGTALLVPGYTSNADTFNCLLEPLSQRGFNVVSFSQRGQHLSEGPSETSGYSLTRLGADIHELISQMDLGPKVHLLGHSFGGVVSTEAVIQQPDVFASLTMWNSGPESMGGDIEAQRHGLLEYGPRAFYLSTRIAAGLDPDADIKGELNVVEQYYYNRLMGTNPAQLEAGITILVDQINRTAELKNTQVPVLVSHGANDDAWPIHLQREMAEELGCDYWVIAHAGHSAHADRSQTSADLLATFWNEHSG